MLFCVFALCVICVCVFVCVCVSGSLCAAKSVLSFLQPAYSYSRQEGVVNIPVSRDILEDGRTQVTYRSHDVTAKEQRVRCTHVHTHIHVHSHMYTHTHTHLHTYLLFHTH